MLGNLRSKKYTDYGISEKTAYELVKYCRSGAFVDLERLKEAADLVNPAISELLVESLIKKLSYEKLCGRYCVPLPKNSFYAYRRKFIAVVYYLINKE